MVRLPGWGRILTKLATAVCLFAKTAVLILSLTCSPAFADLILPPTPWQRLRPRPEVSHPTVYLPASADAVSDDVASGDLASRDTVAETTEQ